MSTDLSPPGAPARADAAPGVALDAAPPTVPDDAVPPAGPDDAVPPAGPDDAVPPAGPDDTALPPGNEERPSNAGALIRLALAVAVLSALFVVFGQTDLLIVILAVIVMVMLHEAGHFVAAKWSHMKVTEFFVGFGPRLWSVRKGETEYGVKALPLGGYVKIPGMTNLEEVPPEDEPRTYRQQPFHNRLAVAVAGSFMHFVMAFILAWAALVFIGTPDSSAVRVGGFVHWPGHARTAAQAAGLHAGDEIVAVNGHRLSRPDQLQTTIGHSTGRPVRLTVIRHGRTLDLTVRPVAGRTTGIEEAPTPAGNGAGHGAGHGIIGVQLGPVNVPENPFAALGSAGGMIGRLVGGEVSGLGRVFSPHGIAQYAQQVSNPQVASRDARNGTPRLQTIVGAVRTAIQGAQAGTFYLLEVLIILNVVIGLVNLLPMLPLDGGHVAIAVYERIRSRRGRPYHADAAKLLPVAYAVVIVLGVIFTTTLYLDLAHPVANPFHG